MSVPSDVESAVTTLKNSLMSEKVESNTITTDDHYLVIIMISDEEVT